MADWELVAVATLLAVVLCISAWLVFVAVRFVARVIVGAAAWARWQRSGSQSAPGGFAVVEPDGPGRYRVSGVMRATEEEVDVEVDARTRANAAAKGEIRGLLVTRVTKRSDAVAHGSIDVVGDVPTAAVAGGVSPGT